ncbi:MAG: hypothetical protein HY848_12150 [Betaproteobacteria bacterium]|nr:hypothetical protein [Betaproteobacteria bacterium]
MKILTTLTAVAALIAGMSIASAQMAPPSGSSTSSPGASGAAPGAAQQATGSGQFCIEAAPGGALNCKYASMAACEKDAKAQNQKCAPNPKASTTGSGQSAPKQ